MESYPEKQKVVNILLVEDNPGDAFIIKDLLRSSGNAYEIEHVNRLSDAIIKIAEKEYDVVLLDLGLPESFGIETIRKINVSEVKAAVIVLTGLDDEEIAVASLKEGAQDYLVKSRLSVENITRVIRYSIERKIIQEVQKRYTEQFSLLSIATAAVNECNDADSIHQVAGRYIKKLLKDNIIVQIEYDHNKDVRAVECKLADTFSEKIKITSGLNFNNIFFRIGEIVPEVFDFFYECKVKEIEREFYDFCKGKYSEDDCLEFVKLTGCTKIYALGFSNIEKYHKGLIIFAKNKIETDDKNIIETIVGQVTLNIHRRVSEHRYHSLFDDSPVSIREEDYRLVKKELKKLRSSGITDLRKYFKENPGTVEKLIRAIKVTDINQAVLDLHDVKSKEEFAANYLKFFSDAIDAYAEVFVRLYAGRTKFDYEKDICTLDGRKKRVFVRWAAADGFEDTIERVLISSIDITEIKNAEEALRILNEELEQRIKERTNALAVSNRNLEKELKERLELQQELSESEEKYRRLTEKSNALICEIDADGIFTFVNSKFKENLGYDFTELIGQTFINLLHPDNFEDFNEQFEKVLDNNKSIEHEWQLADKSGNRRWYNCFLNVVKISQGTTRINIVCFDITDKKIAEEQLEQYASDLKELNATKDKFFKIIAHDLKNPFSGLLGASELLLNHIERYDIERIKKYVKIIFSSSKSGYAILENLLEWSRAQTGNLAFNPDEFNLHDMVTENLRNVQAYAFNKDIDLVSKVKRDLKITADKNMLNTILRNLLNNAVKFTGKGGNILVSAIKENNHVTLAVKDSGVGMSEEEIGKLFRIDVKYSNIGTDNERGTGLGLILCKEFVERHGGRIWVESQTNKGSEFKLSIPLV